MKIAYCVSGHMRTFQETLENQKNSFIDINDCDVFVYTSNFNTQVDGTGTTWDRHEDKRETHFLVEKENVYETSKHFRAYELDERNLAFQVENCYGSRLKKYFIEQEKEEPKKLNMAPVHKNWNWIRERQVRKFYKCNELMHQYEKENNIKYDFVVRSRPDLLFKGKIFVNELVEFFGEEELKNSILVWGGWDPRGDLAEHGMKGYLFDGFAIGTPEVMDKYCDIYECADKPAPGKANNLEIQLKSYLINANIVLRYLVNMTPQTKYVRDEYCYSICR